MKRFFARSAAIASFVAVPGFAMAEAPDTTAILADITMYSGAAILLIIAFAAAVWALRAAGLLGRR